MSDLPDPFELFGLDSEKQSSAPTPASAPYDEPPVRQQPPSPPPPRKKRRKLRIAAIVLGLFVLIIAIGGFWINRQINPNSSGDEVSFAIPKGATTANVVDLLGEKGIVGNTSVFTWYLRFNGTDQFQAGEYEGLRTNMNMGEIVNVLKGGPAPPKTVTYLVREGLWESEFVAQTLEKFPKMTRADLEAALRNTHPALQPAGSTDLEGFLYPATYEVLADDTGNPQKLIDQMMNAFTRVANAEGLPNASTKLRGVAGNRTITPYEALIVASLVESEAKLDSERPKIARVIYNRLAKGEMLGIDASVLYAIGQRKTNLTSRDLRTDSPYNTRLKTGLPPTPINSPGQASIRAALNPAPGDWMYYVLTETDGTHYFSKTLAEHERATADARARGVF